MTVLKQPSQSSWIASPSLPADFCWFNWQERDLLFLSPALKMAKTSPDTGRDDFGARYLGRCGGRSWHPRTLRPLRGRPLYHERRLESTATTYTCSGKSRITSKIRTKNGANPLNDQKGCASEILRSLGQPHPISGHTHDTPAEIPQKVPHGLFDRPMEFP